jgi:murein DD-endopeptidase MepM/ murein hydrolase activator NlpD
MTRPSATGAGPATLDAVCVEVTDMPGRHNYWCPTARQARGLAMQHARGLGPGWTVDHEARPRPHFHVVQLSRRPDGRVVRRRVSGHFFYGGRRPYRIRHRDKGRGLQGELLRAGHESETLNSDDATWVQSTQGVAEGYAVPASAEDWTTVPAVVDPTAGAGSPPTSVEAWAALARALLATGYEAGSGRYGNMFTASPTLEEQAVGELPYPAGGTASSVENAIIKAEIGKGVTSENVLTDLVFHRRYPARNRRPLSTTEPGFQTLSQEWLRIRDTQVRPMLNQRSPAAGRPYVPTPAAGSPGGGALPLPRAAIGRLSELQDPHHDYPAIDLQAPTGTPMYAVVGGTVRVAGDAGGFGPHAVYIEDANGYTWIYGHGSAHFVSVGQRVSAGQRIADVGSLGQSSGPHLHLQIKDPAGVNRCPQPFLTALWNGQRPPPVGALPTSGCSY